MILYGFPRHVNGAPIVGPFHRSAAEAEPVGSLVIRSGLLRLELADIDYAGDAVVAYLTPELARALAEALQLAAGVLDPATTVGAGAMLTGYPPTEAATEAEAAGDQLTGEAAEWAAHGLAEADPPEPGPELLAERKAGTLDPSLYCGRCGILVGGSHRGSAGATDSAGQAWCYNHRPPPRVPDGGHVGDWRPGQPFTAPVPPPSDTARQTPPPPPAEADR